MDCVLKMFPGLSKLLTESFWTNQNGMSHMHQCEGSQHLKDFIQQSLGPFYHRTPAIGPLGSIHTGERQRAVDRARPLISRRNEQSWTFERIRKDLSEVKSFQGPVQPPPGWPDFCTTSGEQKSPVHPFRSPSTVSLLFFLLMVLCSPTEVCGGVSPFSTSP